MKIWRPVEYGKRILTEYPNQWEGIEVGPDTLTFFEDMSDDPWTSGVSVIKIDNQKYQLCEAIDVSDIKRNLTLVAINGEAVAQHVLAEAFATMYEGVIDDLESKLMGLGSTYAAESESNVKLREEVKNLQVKLEAKSREADDYLAQLVKLKREKLGDDKYNRGT